MFDLRNYKPVIMEAVKLESEHDSNWNWKVKAVNKAEVRIGWGYLDWLCSSKESKHFTVKLIVDEVNGKPDVSLAGYYPDDPTMRDSLYVWIGDRHWHDAKTIEDGLRLIVHAIANRAHNTF